jgi:NADH-quinone oxidoreductase subunit L
MAGPTPTSALIHAATMVTAGVYLIARTHVLFALAPSVQLAVATIGTVTLLMAAFSALAQRDIKRVLAYSTISQIGYMFLALGLGAWSAAMFHFMTHAFFKALLFLAAGAVIEALHHEQDMFRMGGLRHQLPLTFWAFLIGGSALAGMPLVTAGFFSKDLILWQSWAGPNGSIWFWLAGMLGALLTSLYTYRLIFLVFYGPQRTQVSRTPGAAMKVAFVILCGLSLLGGYVDTPPDFGGVPALSNFLNSTLPPLKEVHIGPITELITALCASLVFTLGFGFAYLLYGRKPMEQPEQGLLENLWLSGWGFDRLYYQLFVRPVAWLVRVNADDRVDYAFTGIAELTRAGHRLLKRTQTGSLRWYASGLAIGSALFLVIVLFTR